MSKEAAMQAVIEYLSVDVLRLEDEVRSYRELAQVAMAQNAELMKQHAALRQQLKDRRDEMRRYTSQALMASGASSPADRPSLS
jgi:hypothetical protein